MSMIVLTGAPLSTQTLYRFRGHVMYMTREGKARKEQYQWEAKAQWRHKPMAGAVSLIVRLYFKDKRRRDIDNFFKIALDSLSGRVWEDDSQIGELTVSKHIDSDNPRIEITIV